MQDTASMRQSRMNTAVDRPRGGVWRVRPLHSFEVVAVKREQIVSVDTRKVFPARIH